MRLVPLLLASAFLLIVLAPVASAAAVPEVPPTGEHTVGPCTYSYSWMWPGSYSTLDCAHEGQELVYYSSYSTWWGSGCVLYVVGEKVYGCNES